MQLVPQVAATIGVDPLQLRSALAVALDALANETAVWSTGLKLKLEHSCRQVCSSADLLVHMSLCKRNSSALYIFESMTTKCTKKRQLPPVIQDAPE